MPTTSKNPISLIKNAIVKLRQAGALSGVLLFLATFIALIWANLPGQWGASYFHLWEEFHIAISIGHFTLNESLVHWINDGLMAMFFFVIGLEIKREILVGELSTWRKASLPMVAALGGVILPALIYTSFNYGTPAIDGWGVPMATDIAFAIGVMAILGRNVPISLKVFLVALAVVDDIAAVLVIAIFYSSNIELSNLAIGFVCFGIMVSMNLANVRKASPYALIGIGGLWLAFLLSGVHATIAGVLGAFTIPTSIRLNPNSFRKRLDELIQKFENRNEPPHYMLSHEQQELLYEIEQDAGKVEPPLQQLERMMYPWVMYGVMPLFALSNAGIVLTGELSRVFHHPVSLGIILGLVVGKTIGISAFSWLAHKVGLAELPANVRWIQVVGVAMLAGIGFTMALFISGLAFNDPDIEIMSKAGILAGSLIAGVSGYLLLRFTPNKAEIEE